MAMRQILLSMAMGAATLVWICVAVTGLLVLLFDLLLVEGSALLSIAAVAAGPVVYGWSFAAQERRPTGGQLAAGLTMLVVAFVLASIVIMAIVAADLAVEPSNP